MFYRIGFYLKERQKMNLENNSLREEIKVIIHLCKQMEDMNFSWFTKSAGETAIASWESVNGVILPSSYRDWLLFSDSTEIFNFAARFFGLKEMVVQAPYIRNDMVLIGYLIGDGELVCFSKTSGKFYRIFEEKAMEVDSFSEILWSVIDIGKSKLGMDTETDKIGAKIFVMLAQDKKANQTLTQQEHDILTFLQSKIRPNEQGEFVLRGLSLSDMTKIFNDLPIEKRRLFLSKLSDREHQLFIQKIRHQAVQNFWNQERDLIKEGKGTQKWILEQKESIMNISKSGVERQDASHP